MRVLIVGCGYVGLPLAAELARQDHEVFGLRRSASNDAELKAAGIAPLLGDITKPETLAALPNQFDWAVNCVASGGGDAEDYRQLYLQGTRNLIEWLAPNFTPSPPTKEERAGVRRPSASSSDPLTPTLSPLRRGEGDVSSVLKKFVYTSSTGVYGQTDGSVVTETSPTEPMTDTAQVLLETEKLLIATVAERKFPAMILRVAGIYGPNRGHWFKQFLRGEARMEGDGSRLLNMIHCDDVVGAIIAALKNGRPGEIYNAVDDEPVSQRDFFAWLADVLKKPMPPSAPADVKANRKRGITSKKVSNRKLKMELSYQFKYPNFRKGYTAELLSERNM